MAEKWIQGAINPAKKGSLRRALHVKPGKTIPEQKLKKAEKSKNPVMRRRANLAETLSKLRRKK